MEETEKTLTMILSLVILSILLMMGHNLYCMGTLVNVSKTLESSLRVADAKGTGEEMGICLLFSCLGG